MGEDEAANNQARSNGAPGGLLLEVRNLEVSFKLEHSTVYAVQDLSLQVGRGERLGIVGESGSGKSVTALALMHMVPSPGKVTGGQVIFEGRELLGLSQAAMRRIRGARIGMIPQNPLTALNPVLTVQAHFQEVLELHLGLTKRQSAERTVELLRSVGIPDPSARMKEYPHRLSGGQRQRVMIALAMACEPLLLIADEPTTALDVTIQAQILGLFDELVLRSRLASILITHNLGIIAGHCDRVVVMYAGRIMEMAPVHDLFANPGHPYTVGLLRCVPRLTLGRTRVFQAIPGAPPQLTQLPRGCPFAPRCERATEQCHTRVPPLEEVGPGHTLACWHPVSDTYARSPCDPNAVAAS